MPNTVAIVGAGPVGLTLACELAVAGVDAVVLEKLTQPRTTSPGAGINPAVVELFTQRGIMDLLAQDGFTWNGAHFAQLPLDPTQLPEKRAFNFIVSHMKVEQRLEEFAVAHGARIERGHEVVGLEQSAGGVVVRTRTADGEREFAADYVVACDGTRSTVSDRDNFYVAWTVPNAYGGETVATTETVDLSVVNANPDGIIPGFHDGSGNAVTQATIAAGNNNTTWYYVDQPTTSGTYQLQASVAGVGSGTSGVQTVASPVLQFHDDHYGNQTGPVIVGKGMGPATWAPVRLAVSTISPVEVSSTR